jgi:hypothetical protein
MVSAEVPSISSRKPAVFLRSCAELANDRSQLMYAVNNDNTTINELRTICEVNQSDLCSVMDSSQLRFSITDTKRVLCSRYGLMKPQLRAMNCALPAFF